MQFNLCEELWKKWGAGEMSRPHNPAVIRDTIRDRCVYGSLLFSAFIVIVIILRPFVWEVTIPLFILVTTTVWNCFQCLRTTVGQPTAMKATIDAVKQKYVFSASEQGKDAA